MVYKKADVRKKPGNWEIIGVFTSPVHSVSTYLKVPILPMCKSSGVNLILTRTLDCKFDLE